MNLWGLICWAIFVIFLLYGFRSLFRIIFKFGILKRSSVLAGRWYQHGFGARWIGTHFFGRRISIRKKWICENFCGNIKTIQSSSLFPITHNLLLSAIVFQNCIYIIMYFPLRYFSMARIAHCVRHLFFSFCFITGSRCVL